MSHTVPHQYILEANAALAERLLQALDHEDWDAVEACANALYEFAQTITKPRSKK